MYLRPYEPTNHNLNHQNRYDMSKKTFNKNNNHKIIITIIIVAEVLDKCTADLAIKCKGANVES